MAVRLIRQNVNQVVSILRPHFILNCQLYFSIEITLISFTGTYGEGYQNCLC